MARYDAERLGNGLSRVRPLRPDDPVLKEGYFSKLTDSTSGRVWGTRQENTPLTNINREDDTSLPTGTRTISMETFQKYRDRIMEAIDKMTYLAENGQRQPLNIDILGDIVEASNLSPNRQYYGEWGLHNIGHLLIALCHDPEYKHRVTHFEYYDFWIKAKLEFLVWLTDFSGKYATFIIPPPPPHKSTPPPHKSTPTPIHPHPYPPPQFLWGNVRYLGNLTLPQGISRCPIKIVGVDGGGGGIINAKHMGVMGDTSANMRDPAFYRWHKYIDELFDLYKQTMQPYNPTGGELQLVWDGVQVQNIQVQAESSRQGLAVPPQNVLRTFRMRSHVDLSRGLDYLRWGENLGPIFARTTHLNHDAFTYTINVQNNGAARTGTIRIYLAPRFNEHGERLPMVQQRLLFFELDKFTTQLNPGVNAITRRSTQSNVTIPWDQSFRQLERSVQAPSAEQSACGCGWPQHMLIPRGNPSGQLYDLVVFVTNGEDDRVVNPQPANNRGRDNCRQAMAYCGILDQLYPDRKPMGYPFDRNPYTVPSPSNPNGAQIPVPNLDEYISRIPNMRTIQVRIVYDAERIDIRGDDGVPTGMRVISGDPLTPVRPGACGNGGARGSSPLHHRHRCLHLLPVPLYQDLLGRRPITLHVVKPAAGLEFLQIVDLK
ncbi:Phenoloxidase 3 [Folsomia candida]|uniref:Phenoloxidase 3 n=1 Tax=Folsomia candida TaxID=158441 RepID=A0A226ELQ5_FOLCA|nr:Phenoloxidase 3 [Folsomia candida]